MFKKTITEYIDSVSKSVDNDSIVYVFESGFAFGVSMDKLKEQKPAWHTNRRIFDHYDHYLKQLLGTGKIKNVLYKNKIGQWIKIFPILNDYPLTTDPFNLANDEEMNKKYILSPNLVPELYYTDNESNIYHIFERDNSKSYIPKTPIFLDENNTDIIEMEQFSIENPNYSHSLRHLMNDLRIKFKTEVPENILINLNGIFIEPVKLSAYPDSLFIKNARWVYRTVKKVLKDEAEPELYESSSAPLAVANYKDSDFLRTYSINIRLFKWENVSISNWIGIENVNYNLQVLEFKNNRIPSSLLFSEELNNDDTIIICNGLIMDPSEYKINGRTVELLNTVEEFHRLYNEFKEKNMTTALNEALMYINNRYYYAVRFKDLDPNFQLKLRRTSPLEIGFLSYDSVLFDNVNSQDLIIVDGAYLPYLIESNGLIRYPKMVDDNLYYKEDILPFKKRKITKFEFVNYYNL